MRKKLIVVPAVLLLVGAAGVGTKLVHADSRTQPAHITTLSPVGADGDTVNQQVGDKNAPDTGAAAKAVSNTPDTDNVQSGDQTGADTPEADSGD